MSGYGSMGSMNEGQQDAQQIKDEAKQKAGEVVEQAKQKGGEVVEQTRTRAFDMMDQQKSRAAEGLGGVASALRQTGETLRSGDQAQFGEVADRAADFVERFSDELRNRDVNDLLYEAERFARREPELFLGGAVLLGLVAARFLKASGRRNYDRGMGDYGRSGRYEYGDRFSGYGSGQYGGEIDYRTTGTGGYRTSGAAGGAGMSGSGSYGSGSMSGSGAYGSGAMGGRGAFGSTGSGLSGDAGQSWSPSSDMIDEDDSMHHHDSESDWTGDGPAHKADSSQA